MVGVNYFGIVDYFAVAGTLLFSLLIGLYYAFVGKQTNEEMLVGGRTMRTLPIAASMLVTYLSAITILGYPAEVYSYGIQIFIMTIMSCIFVPLSTLVFIRVFYNMKLTSVYEYLERRFDSIIVRWLASFTFILQISLLNGVVLYAPAIALEAILGLPVWISIVGIGLIGTVYTSVGGIKAVVVTDVFQFFMIAVGLVSIMVRGFISAGGVAEAFRIAGEKGRLVLFDFSFDPFMRHNFWNFFFGYGFSILSLFGTHQPQVQRYCSLPSLQHAVKALLFTIPMKTFTMSLVVLTGISVFAKYSGCCPILLGKIKKADYIIPHFVIEELSFIPGMMGIFVSCIFSAVLSSVSSTLNSLAAVTWEDFISKIPRFSRMEPSSKAMCIRIISMVYGILSINLAFGAQNVGAIFQATMTAWGATSGPLGASFICGLFFPCMNKYGIIAGMLSGLITMMYVGIQSFILKKTHNFNPRLPTSLDDCPVGTDFSKAVNYTLTAASPELEWPTKIFTLSYILYPIIGAIITMTVGLIVSFLTGGFFNCHKVPRKYLHPLLHSCGCSTGDVDHVEVKTSLQNGDNKSYKNGKTKVSSPSYSQNSFTQTSPELYHKYPYKYEKVSSPSTL